MTAPGARVRRGEPTAKMPSASLPGSTPAALLSSCRIFASMGVAVGEVRLSVSEIKPAINKPAIDGPIGMPCCLYDNATSVLVEPTGLFQKRIGISVLKLASL